MSNQYDNLTDSLVVKILQTNTNDSDSMVFGLNSETNKNNKLPLEKSNPFFKDTIGVPTDSSNPVFSTNFIKNNVLSNSIVDKTNLTMVILKVKTKKKIFLN